jgi:hypothetical protein
MLLLLNVFLLLSGALAAVAAIGGETWRKDEPRVFKRLTSRGWISIVCVVIALGIGVWKEFLVDGEGAQQKRENAQLRGQIKILGDLLKDANTTLRDTQTKLTQAQVSTKKITEGIQAYVYDRLALHTRRFLGVIWYMIEDATDGWLPASEGEFFSQRTAKLVCSELNGNGPARVSPPQPWFNWIASSMRTYKAELAELLKSHGPQLDTSFFRLIANVEQAPMFWLIPDLASARQTDELAARLPPVLCPGDEMQAQVERDFGALAALYTEIKNGTRRFRLLLRDLPLRKQTIKLGRNRFTPEQLSKWQKDHGS